MEPSPHLRFPVAPTCADDPSEAFTALVTDPAGAVPRPPADAAASDLRDLPDRFVRVLDEDGRAVGPWDPSLDRDALVSGLRDLVTVRAFDAAMLRAHRQGKTSFYMVSLGEEAVSCAHRRALTDGDMAFPTYRQQGLLVAAGYPLVDMMNQVLSNSHDPIKGRQLPVFYTSREKGFFSISGNLATQYVQAVGWAMAAAIRGEPHIASAWIGEGATAESDFHSALLFASVYNAPVVFNIVNNQWAISTHERVARGQAPSFAHRGLGYGLPGLRVDGNDYLAVHAATSWAAERARSGAGPCVIEWVTFRAGAHSTSDDPDAYRPRSMAEGWPFGDPVERLAQHLDVAHGWHGREELEASVAEQVDSALAEAESYGTVKNGPWSPPGSMFDDVFATPTPHLVEQREQAGC